MSFCNSDLESKFADGHKGKTKAMFVFWKVFSGKLFSKLFCVCLLLEKLVNKKHFPVKGKFGLVFRKVFSWKFWAKNTLQKL
jgi:hypothetical protein